MNLFSRSRPLGNDPARLKRALDATLSVSEIASSSVALPAAMQQVVRTAIELLDAEQSSLMLLDQRGKDLVLVASAGLPTSVGHGHRMPVGEGVAGRVMATGRSLLLGDIDKDAFINFVPKDRPISSSVVAPLRVHGRSIGVLSLGISKGSRPFTEEDRRLVQMFADQAAGLIHRTRLHEQAEQRSSDLTALIDANKRLLGTIELETLLQGILDGAKRLVGVPDGLACLFDNETGSLKGGVFRGLEKPLIRSLTEQIETRRLIDTADIGLVDIESMTFVALGLRSSQGTKGLLVIPGGSDLLQERGHLLTAFGAQCSSALGAAELYSMVERKETELGSIIKSVPNPIVLVDAARKIVSINPPAEALFGVSEMFAEGVPVQGTLENEEIEAYLVGEADMIGEVQIGVPAQTFKIRATDVRVPGAPMGRLLVMDDITRDREMAQTQHDFVAMIGHELRTPLTLVKGFSKMLLRRGDSMGPEDTFEALSTIDAKASELERLIEDLLYVSGVESREGKLRIEELDVREVVETTVMELLVEHADREVSLDLPATLDWSCDRTKLTLILRHLVDNACKYSDAPETIVVRATETEDELQIDVVDRGLGIVSSDIPHIFELFRQIDGSATREHGGTGVGLYLCSRLVKAQEGRIWVDSTWGKGSTFSFALPRRRLTNNVTSLKGPRALLEETLEEEGQEDASGRS